MRKYSKKRAALERKIRAAKKEVIEGRKNVCEGTGTPQMGYDASHIIPISRRLDLADDPRNIRKLGRRAHVLWETHHPKSMSKLICFAEDMEYIFEKDREYWFKIIGKVLDITKIDEDNPTQRNLAYYQIKKL